MYTNKINGKQYIGQTTRTLKKRHLQHLSQSESYFDRALRKYGMNNFKLEVLEDDIFDEDELNKKEIYYIEKFDTFNDGYNMNRGGDNRTRFSKEDRDRIIDLIKNTKLSFAEIGKITGYSVYTISDINSGDTFSKEGEEYPIRKRRCCEKFDLDDVEMVINLLETTDFSFNKIAEITSTTWYFVCDINQGKRSFLKNTEYDFPIRKGKQHCKMSLELAMSIIEKLKENNMSAEEVSKIFNIPTYTVGQINRGKHSICKQIDEDFPIRKKEYRSVNYGGRKLSNDELFEIIDLLLNTKLSTEEIARRYNVDRTAVNRINRGASFKNIIGNYKFPIRQNKEYNLQIYGSVNE